MKRDYRFENVVCKGKRLGFTVHDVVDFQSAKEKAVNFCIYKFNLSKDEFKTQLNYLTQNIENGETKVTPLEKIEQLELDMESKRFNKFNKTFGLLYKGIINEWKN